MRIRIHPLAHGTRRKKRPEKIEKQAEADVRSSETRIFFIVAYLNYLCRSVCCVCVCIVGVRVDLERSLLLTHTQHTESSGKKERAKQQSC